MMRDWKKAGLGVMVLVLVGGVPAWLYAYQTRTPDFGNLAYAEQSPSQKLDLYIPKGAGPFPVVVFIHGGAFRYGDKVGLGPGFRHDVDTANAAGIAFASINYRMSGEARFPAAVQDAREAVRYLRANAQRYRLNPALIALWGQSAGGNIALVSGLATGEPRFDLPGSALRQVPSRVSAIISMYGPTQFLEMDAQLKAQGCAASRQDHNHADSPESLYLGAPITTIPNDVAAASAITWVTPTAPPVLLQHGSADCTVPTAQSGALAARFNAVAGPGRAVFEVDKGADHADSRFDAVANVQRVMTFLTSAFVATK